MGADRLASWLRSNTFHHGEFADVAELVRLKREGGVRISCCIPTLDEEKTIGKVIVVLRAALMERQPLLDEIAVIDSGSSDATCEIAGEFGASVYRARDILPGEGQCSGKGENLWKAVYQLGGDILCYIDADIRNIHPRFVYGLVGPLLRRPEVGYVKAFYDRPMASPESGVRPSGGGRVTEILVRPLLSLFFPELVAILQPLSGEYAVRRRVLERIPFPVGYGVEIAHLLDVYHRWGIGAFAQTDLDRRVHRNQPVEALGRMSFGILRAFLRRLEGYGVLQRMPELPEILSQFQVRGGSYELVDHSLAEEERPPMMSLPEYKERFGAGPEAVP